MQQPDSVHFCLFLFQCHFCCNFRGRQCALLQQHSFQKNKSYFARSVFSTGEFSSISIGLANTGGGESVPLNLGAAWTIPCRPPGGKSHPTQPSFCWCLGLRSFQQNGSKCKTLPDLETFSQRRLCKGGVIMSTLAHTWGRGVTPA